MGEGLKALTKVAAAGTAAYHIGNIATGGAIKRAIGAVLADVNAIKNKDLLSMNPPDLSNVPQIIHDNTGTTDIVSYLNTNPSASLVDIANGHLHGVEATVAYWAGQFGTSPETFILWAGGTAIAGLGLLGWMAARRGAQRYQDFR